MEQWQQWFQEKQVERTINALKKNNFEAVFVPDSKSACEEVMKQIPDGATVGVGGSVTLAKKPARIDVAVILVGENLGI
ncbi:MAG: LUD domain-containing protein [Syntrophaceae bacterium]|nr:LUD domain-containing protein [Syntrophaceae bacterium]